MIVRTSLKGTLVLAASAAAALAACSSDETTPAPTTTAASSSSSSSGTGGAAASSTASSGGAASSATGTGGTGGTGGTAGTGGAGGAGGEGGIGGAGGAGGGGGAGPSAAQIVANQCPDDVGDYTIIEGTPMADTLTDADDVRNAYIGFGGPDAITTNGSKGNGTSCAVGGPGADTITLDGTAGGTVAEYTGNFGSVHIHTGAAPDVVNYRVDGSDGVSPGFNDYREPITVSDFQTGVDKFRINMALANVSHEGTVADIAVQVETGFNAATLPPMNINNCTGAVIVLDPTDGEVWLSYNCESVAYNYLLATVSGSTLVASDIELYVD